MFDPELFGHAMAAEIQKAVAPLRAEIAELRIQLVEAKTQEPDFHKLVADEVAKIPPAEKGKDADESAIVERVTKAIKADLEQWKGEAQESLKAPELPDIKGMVESAVTDAVKAIPPPKDGKSVTLDDVRPIIEEEIDKAVKQIPAPKDGIGMAGAMIDRDGNLIITTTSGETKNLGPVVGKDGLSFESFDIGYDAEEKEVVIRVSSALMTKEVRYPAGGIHGKGYWRAGSKAVPGEAWSHDGNLWIATKSTSEAPTAKSDCWFLAARRGRDGESVVRKVSSDPKPPVKLDE